VAVAARSDRLARTRALTLVHVKPLHWLGAIVAASFVVRTLTGLLRASPVYFPDEYIYWDARSPNTDVSSCEGRPRTSRPCSSRC
jgi:hypothetical protein